MNIHRHKPLALAIASLALLLACGGGPLQVTSPKLSNNSFAEGIGWHQTTDGRIEIDITFNQSINPASVIIGKTLILSTPGFPVSTPGTVTVSNNGTTLVFQTQGQMQDVLLFQTQPSTRYSFTLTLVGTDRGQGAILDASGSSLDGDYDNQPGGDYILKLARLG